MQLQRGGCTAAESGTSSCTMHNTLMQHDRGSPTHIYRQLSAKYVLLLGPAACHLTATGSIVYLCCFTWLPDVHCVQGSGSEQELSSTAGAVIT
jgi:hypothetical protein